MTLIINLSSEDAVVDADQFPIYSAANGDARRVPASVAKEYFQEGAIATDDKESQYLTPLTGFSKTITPTVAGGSVLLILSPAGTIATGTIVLPSIAAATVADRQEVLVTTTNTVTTLTVNAAGTTVVGVPTTITAATPFKMRYDAVTSAWYRVV